MERKVKLAMLGALTGNSIFGFSFMFSRMALGITSPFVMLMVRFIFAAALLGVIALVPIVALTAGALVLREIPSRAQVGWSLFSIAGVVMMTLQQSADGAIRPLGVVMLFGAVLSGVTYNILSRRMSAQYSALERTVDKNGSILLETALDQ